MTFRGVGAISLVIKLKLNKYIYIFKMNYI
jgi:hypothetical protein